MSNVFRLGLTRLVCNTKSSLFNNTKICVTIQKCNISGKTLRGGEKFKPKPWPYKTKKYGMLNVLFDKTTHRFDENSKVIVVEGPIAAGKTKLAQELANELEMLYIPEANMDMLYINQYGYDMRQLDPQLPESCRSYDEKDFCKNPTDKKAANFQIQMLYLRYSQYFDAIAHLLNTGQGVILDRCVYSDFVFMEAMYKCGFISRGARSVYNEIRSNVMDELIYPHLIIYLDIGVDEIQKRLAKRAKPHEKNSKALTSQFLTNMEYEYKQNYLKAMSTHSELLVYDWTSHGDTEVVIEDIERIDFGRFGKQDSQLKEWRIPREWDWAALRMKFTNDKERILTYFNIPRFDVPELLLDPYDAKKFREVWFDAPGMKYAHGYNEDMGDTGIITKMK